MNEKQRTIYAEDVPYWQTGQSSADVWIERAKKEIASIGGKIIAEGFGADQIGHSAFMIGFSIGNETFKLIWPVLPSKTGKERAARVQAATALYHDVKARVVSAKFIGTRGAFFSYLMLANGQTVNDATQAQFLELVPNMLLSSGK